MASGGDFNLDKQEYQSVFKVFDKDNTGEINIHQVYELINKFDDAQRLADGGSGNAGVHGNEGGSTILNTAGIQSNPGGLSKGSGNITKTATIASKSPTKKSSTGLGAGGGLQLKPTTLDGVNGKSPRMIGEKSGANQQQTQAQKDAHQVQLLSEEVNFGNVPLIKSSDQQEDKKQQEVSFPNGKQTLKFDEFFNIIKESCMDREQAENYLVYAFSMFDRKRKGFINTEDLKEVFSLLGESVTDDEVNTMIKIAGVKSNDKINFKEFVDFFNKAD